MRKPLHSTFWEKWPPVIFRLFVAIIISFSISRPMEIKMYEKKLPIQIEKDRLDFIDREWDKRNIKIIEYDNSLNQINILDTTIINQQNQGPQNESYKILLEDRKQAQENLKNIEQKNNTSISNCQNRITNLQNSPNSYYTDSIGNKHLTQSARNTIGSLRQQIKSYEKEISDKRDNLSNIGQDISNKDSAFKEGFRGILQNNQDERQAKIEERRKKHIEDSLALDGIKRESLISYDAKNPGLITQLESMNNFEKTEQGKSVKLIRWVLLLLIISIDTAPIVIKVLTKRGTYDELLEETADRLSFLSKNENVANKFLIKEMSIALREVFAKAIEQWKDRELIDENIAQHYINNGNNNEE